MKNVIGGTGVNTLDDAANCGTCTGGNGTYACLHSQLLGCYSDTRCNLECVVKPIKTGGE